jgi:hypothetical protein
MNRIAIPVVVGLLLVPLQMAIANQDSRRMAAGPLDLGKCHLVVQEVNQVEKIEGDRGKTTEASKRGSVLIELEIHGTGPSEGKVGLYPSMFSLTCVYRGVQRILPSLAIGIKPRMPTGEIQPYWLNNPEASMLIGCYEDEDIEFYVIFEVPEEVKEFAFQIPRVLQQVSAGSP